MPRSAADADPAPIAISATAERLSFFMMIPIIVVVYSPGRKPPPADCVD